MKKITVLFLMLATMVIIAQEQKKDEGPLTSSTFSGLKWRNIGPAYCSGRIADFAVNPNDFSEYYVAVASGHVWKTTNSGTTWSPIFDNQGSYSNGVVVIDPNNPFVVWVGTGENNHQRALGYGNGVFKSTDGGASWNSMGLKDSRQIGDIVIDPRNSNIVFVAAEGSVWGPGGERGLYKSVDGGKTWKKTLEISENTGVNNVTFDPRNPDVMYATSEQRRRHVWTKIGGGPESAVYKSEDGGNTWYKIMSGLPSAHIGGTDLAISPANPDVIYLSLEAANAEGGFFRSTNRGASWQKMSSTYSKGQYFNEIYADPKDVDRVYLMDVVSKVTEDGGKTFTNLETSGRHVDDHALWINPKDTRHLLIGGDGGIYESFDRGKTWDFKENLPIVQFYRVNVDNSYPFYYVYGGTQDNNSMGGPSRTTGEDGIVNSDWFVTNGGDGFWTAIDPENPNIVYAEAQYGNMVRYDRASGESIFIRPEPRKDELTYRWNWNTPLFISPHNNKRLYVAANKVFRSENRGDAWDVISEDLTRNMDRNTFAVMGKYWSSDAVEKDASTSLYGTIISMAESPVKENLLYVGTDDGVIQISEDAKTWRKVESFPDVPEYTYVSDILPSRFDENVVYASFDNILRDDFKPYILKSTDKGKSWKSIASNLPANGTVHSIEQDFVNKDLLFVGTEFGFFFTIDGGEKWVQLKSGMPDVPVRDIVLQKRENDIVVATFGRGFYIIDDYSSLRSITKASLEQDDALFPVREGLMYVPSTGRYGQGHTYYKAPNPEFGVSFTYYLKSVPKTKKQLRKEKEKELFEAGKPIPQLSDEDRIAESREVSPYLQFTIKDQSGNEVRKLFASASKGMNRITWDFTYSPFTPLSENSKFDPTAKVAGSTYVLPGSYTVTAELIASDSAKQIGTQPFEAKLLRNSTLPFEDSLKLVAYQKEANEIARTIYGTYNYLQKMLKQVEQLRQTAHITPGVPRTINDELENLWMKLDDISLKFQRRGARPSVEETPPSAVTLFERLETLIYIHYRGTQKLTANEITALEVLKRDFPSVYNEIEAISKGELVRLVEELERYKAAPVPGTLPKKTW